MGISDYKEESAITEKGLYVCRLYEGKHWVHREKGDDRYRFDFRTIDNQSVVQMFVVPPKNEQSFQWRASQVLQFLGALNGGVVPSQEDLKHFDDTGILELDDVYSKWFEIKVEFSNGFSRIEIVREVDMPDDYEPEEEDEEPEEEVKSDDDGLPF